MLPLKVSTFHFTFEHKGVISLLKKIIFSRYLSLLFFPLLILYLFFYPWCAICFDCITFCLRFIFTFFFFCLLVLSALCMIAIFLPIPSYWLLPHKPPQLFLKDFPHEINNPPQCLH